MKINKTFCSTIAAAALLFPFCGDAAPKTRVFILSGQSNCVGAGNGELLPPEYKMPDAEAIMFSRWTGNVWVPLAPYSRKAEKFGIEKTAFGPELIFGREMRRLFPNDSIAIIKQASGGTSVVAWEKEHGTPEYADLMKEAGHVAGNQARDPQYPILLKTIQDGLAGLDGPYEVSGFLWFQAERDARSELLSSRWAERVLALVDNLAEDIGFSKDIPLFVMDPHFESNNLTTQPHGAQIVSALLPYAKSGETFSAEDLQKSAGLEERSPADFIKVFQKVSGRWGGFFDHAARISGMKRSLRAMADERPKTEIIFVDDLPTYEGVHFNTDAQIEIGKRLAVAFKNLFAYKDATSSGGAQ